MRPQSVPRMVTGSLAAAGIAVALATSATAASTDDVGSTTAVRPTRAVSSTRAVAANEVTSTATRPQLTSAQADKLTPSDYLQGWTPPRIPSTRARDATYTVDPAGAYPTVQSAINAAVAAGGSARTFIAVRAGVHREVVCVPTIAGPITLFGTAATAAETVIVFDHANPTPKTPGTIANPCSPNLASATYGTSGSATFAAFADDFQATNLTFANDYVEGTYPSGNQSAVALTAAGDRQVYEDIQVLGNQDSLLAHTRTASVTARQYIRDSVVAGDVDFIFGRGTTVFDHVEVRYLSSRQKNGVILAPSTAAANPFGFLFIRSQFSVDNRDVVGTVRLGRAWDEGVGSLTNYVNGVSPNGQALIRQSRLDKHIQPAAPWGASTASRPFCVATCTYSPNRLAEYRNVGHGSAD